MLRNGFLAALTVSLVFAATITSEHFVEFNPIVEENNLWIGTEEKNKGISEAVFNDMIDRTYEIYAPIVANMNMRLNIIRKWSDGTVNAYARRVGNTMEVNMFGGLARHEAVTAEGFAMVVCHEIGHHIGGAPKMGGFMSTWASNEGQSDYWASMKCMRKVFENDDNLNIVAQMNVPEIVSEKCNAVFQNAHDSALCARVSMGGHSLGELFRHLRNLPESLRFDTPDTNVVSRTSHTHPAPQCRLDTYFQGALCDKSAYEDTSNSNVNIGVCARRDGYTEGTRPLCWYKP